MAAMLFAAQVAAQPVDEKQVESYLQAFFAVALWTAGQNPGEGNQPQPRWLSKVNEPLRIRIIGPESEDKREAIEQGVKEMADLAGVGVIMLPAGDTSESMLIELRYRGPTDSFRCQETSSRTPTGQIRYHLLVDPTGARRCIRHETMHALGFAHLHDFDSIMSYVYRREEPTALDRILIRILYDQRLKSNMRWLPAMAAARAVLAEHLIANGAPPETAEMGWKYVRNLVPMMSDMAEQGNVPLQVQLGLIYTFGEATALLDKDEAKGYIWFRRAAEAGNSDGQFYVGYGLMNGRGVGANPAEGARWYQTAADRGHVIALNNLGVAYRDGKGVTKDPVEAYKWLSLSAARRFALAETNLRQITPVLTAEDIVEAKRRAAQWKPAQ